MNKKKYVFSFFNDTAVAKDYRFESQAALFGVCDTVLAAGLAPSISRQSLLEAGSLSSAIEVSKLPNGQVDRKNLLSELETNNLVNADSPKFILLSSDLVNDEDGDSEYGFASKENGLVVESVYRLKNIGSAAMNLALRHIASHETAHMLGLDIDTIKRVDQTTGHCANECTMRQVNNLEETLNLAYTLKNRRAAGFCIDCAGVLRDINS